jgi:membrane fusion protein, multidrug efflux system
MAEDRTTYAPQPKEPQAEPRPQGSGPSEDDQEKQEKEKKPHPVRKALIIAGAIVVAVLVLAFWLHSRHFEDTDDAYVDAHISGIAARVAGTVTGVYVEENDSVKAGQTLVDLDPRDYQVAVEQARSQLQQAQEQTEAEQPNVPVTEVTNQTNISTTQAEVLSAQAAVSSAERDYDAAVARVHEAEANSAHAQSDVERYRPLAEKDEVPREQFDALVATAKAQAATVAANQASAQASLKQVDQRRAELAEAQKRNEEAQKNAPRQIAIRRADVASRQSNAAAARAQLDQALLNLSYCKIVSPVDGIVAKRVAEVGDRVSPGQQVVLIAQIDDLWVTANFRETQIRRMRPGQSVRIHVDALGKDFDGYVEGMPAASGAVTSLLPPENATGNFVKVVQRLPVRIRFRAGQQGLERLRPGMSVEPKVRVE